MTILPAARERIAERQAHLLRVREHVVIDADTHPSDPRTLPPAMAARVAADPGYFHGRPISGEELLAELDVSGVDMALAWQNPAATAYPGDPAGNRAALLAANRYVADLAARHPTRIIPAGWTDPRALGVAAACALAQLCVRELGMPVVKLNPAQNRFPIDDPAVTAVVDAIVAEGAVPAFHFGSDTPFTPAAGLERVALRHPDHPLIAVHMGGGGGGYVEGEVVYQAARVLGLRRPNLFYVLSAKRDTHIESALLAYAAAGPPFSANLAVASDAPYGRHPDPRVRARPGLLDDQTVQGFMGRNLADLVIAADRRLLARAVGRDS